MSKGIGTGSPREGSPKGEPEVEAAGRETPCRQRSRHRDAKVTKRISVWPAGKEEGQGEV